MTVRKKIGAYASGHQHRSCGLGWEVHAYSGARFSHIVQLPVLRQVVNNSLLELKTVIIAAGINHRDDGDHRCVAQLRELHAVVNFLDNMGIHTTVIGVSYSVRTKGLQKVDETC